MRKLAWVLAGVLLGALLVRPVETQTITAVRFSSDALLSLNTLFVTQTTAIVAAVRATRPVPVPLSPCLSPQVGNAAISQTASTKIITGLPAQRVALCSARVVAGAAEILSWIEGTGAACATGTLAVSGSTTAANGESYAANGGFASSGSGVPIAVTAKAGDDVCLSQSGANRLAGNVVYVYIPYP